MSLWFLLVSSLLLPPRKAPHGATMPWPASRTLSSCTSLLSTAETPSRARIPRLQPFSPPLPVSLSCYGLRTLCKSRLHQTISNLTWVASGVWPMGPAKLVLMARLLPTLSSTSLLSPCLAFGCSSPMTPCLHRTSIPSLINDYAHTFRSFSLGGFWAYGISTEGGLRVGDDDEGA